MGSHGTIAACAVVVALGGGCAAGDLNAMGEPPSAGASATDAGADAASVPSSGPIAADAGPRDAVASPEAAAPSSTPGKGIWAWGSTVRGHESAFVSWLSAHDYSDLFLLIKGVSGTSSFDVLSATMAARAASKRPLRVWAWLVGFHDQSHDPSWRYVVGDWVAPDDPKYVAHLTDLVRSAIDPARGHVAEPPDGVMLDDSFEWPGPSYGGTTAAKVQSLMAAIDAIRAEVSAVAQSAKKNVLLGFAPLPETGVVSKTSTSITTAAAASYGQDFGEIAKRCDWIVPETYRYGFYPEQAPWIAQVVADIRKEVTLECGARAAAISVAPVLVLYESDANPTAISSTDLGADLGYAKKAGGYSVFRYTSHTANPGAGADGRDQPTAAQITVLDQP